MHLLIGFEVVGIMYEVISSEGNDKVKYLKKLYQTCHRKKEGKFILEGYRIIEEAVKSRIDMETIFVTPCFFESKEGQMLQKMVNENLFILLDYNLLKKISDTQTPQGVIAVVKEPVNSNDFLNTGDFFLILDRIQDPGNMGTLIRTALAAGVKGIIALKGCVDIYNLKVIRATMGAIFNIPILTGLELSELYDIVDSVPDARIVSTDISGDKYYNEVKYTEPVFIIIGNEGNGTRQELLDRSHYKIKIPLYGEIDSLNAAIAAGVVLYEVANQKYRK